MERTVQQAAFELLTALPETEQTTAHGSPVFKVSGKTYAYWAVNHHGDGRLAIWLGTTPEQQAALLADGPTHFFVPPYVGVKGYVGIDLASSPSWTAVTELVHAAWRNHAPVRLRERDPGVPESPPPETEVQPEEINPLLGDRPQEILRGLAKRCRRLPETTAEDPVASATWRAGKRPFIRARFADDLLRLMFQVGVEQQSFMLDDPRYGAPPYYGPSGWVEVDVQDRVSWEEIEALIDTAYRQVALKRMLKALDAPTPGSRKTRPGRSAA
jgi:hypothetical protein